MGELDRIEARDRRTWRTWLERNHLASKGIQLVYYKKGSGTPSVSYAEAVEEALCFGWIDSRINTLDDKRYMQVFTPRNPKSAWSALNKRRAQSLIEQGLMTKAGLDKIEQAKQDGSWAAYDGIEQLTVPRDLAAALKKAPGAADAFKNLRPSLKKHVLWSINDAKKPETRARRIEKIAAEVTRKGFGQMTTKKADR